MVYLRILNTTPVLEPLAQVMSSPGPRSKRLLPPRERCSDILSTFDDRDSSDEAHIRRRDDDIWL